jgi:transcriptional regulator with XRE-family HTH domain
MVTKEEKDFNLALGRRLAEAREKAGLKSVYVGALLGVTGACVSMWEWGRVGVNAYKLQRLCEIYGVDPAGMLRGLNFSANSNGD